MIDLEPYPNLSRLTDAVLKAWPEHRKYLTKNYAEREAEILTFSEVLAEMVVRLAATASGDLDQLAIDYRFLSEKIIMPEEIHFRRHDEYRLKTFKDALEQVYDRTEFMTRYMNGLLLSDVIWLNHCRCMHHFSGSFLPSLKAGTSLLEIGPGHGLLLCLAARLDTITDLHAWDVSQASIESSRHSLETLGVTKPTTFERVDIFDPDTRSSGHAFDAIVLSEVLEHLETPVAALDALFSLVKPGGLVWINVPVNSPAPDHLFLLRSPDEASELVRKAGFEVVDAVSYPMSGTTLARAAEEALTVNCVVVGKRP